MSLALNTQRLTRKQGGAHRLQLTPRDALCRAR